MFVHKHVTQADNSQQCRNGLGNATYKLVCETRQGILKSSHHSWELRCRPLSVLDPTFMPKTFLCLPLMYEDGKKQGYRCGGTCSPASADSQSTEGMKLLNFPSLWLAAAASAQCQGPNQPLATRLSSMHNPPGTPLQHSSRTDIVCSDCCSGSRSRGYANGMHHTSGSCFDAVLATCAALCE